MLYYSREEIKEIDMRLAEEIAHLAKENPDARPLPPMTEEEAKGLLVTFVGIATLRLLTQDEAFFGGQLIAAYRISVEARMLGQTTERYIVISEKDLARVAALRNRPWQKEE